MANIQKKRKKLEDRIKFLENEMLLELKQKTSSTPEINLAKYQNEIARLRIELQKL